MIQAFLFRQSGRLVERIGALTLLRLLLLWLALACTSAGLLQVVQHLQFTWSIRTALLGVLLGWLLARSRRSGWRSALLASAAGIAWLVLAVGRIFVPLGSLFSSLFDVYRAYFWHPFAYLLQPQSSFIPADLNPVVVAAIGLMHGLAALSIRLVNWLRGAATGTGMVDPLVINLVWCAAVWLGSVWAAWCVRRKGAALLGLLPAAALLAYNVYYVNSLVGLVWLVALGGCMLLLQAASGYLSAWERWQAVRMDQSELEPGLAAAVLGIAFVLTLTAAISPSLSIHDIRYAVDHLLEVRQNRVLAESLGLEQTTGSGGGRGGGSGVPITSQHQIGPGPHLSSQVVLSVSVEGYVPPSPGAPLEAQLQTSPPSFHWRGQTYDQYSGYGWFTLLAFESDSQANQALTDASLPEGYRPVRQRVQRIGEQSETLFVSGDLLSVDQAFHTLWRETGDLIGAQTGGAAYEAESRLPFPSVSQLRSAGVDYPTGIMNRYLQLPDSLPARVRNLALDLTSTQPTPYDQATAIQAYLRTFPYSLDVPAPPYKRDAVDYFLFDLKKGYCDYYATAMAVMARAAGIPSRVVSGYSTGEYDYARGQFIVTAANAHAWVEIYFPGTGWVEFEPTANQPAIARPEGGERPEANGPAVQEAGGDASRIFPLEWLRRLAPGLLAALAGLLILLLLPIEGWSLLLVPADRAVTIIYHRLYRLARGLQIQKRAARTPREFAVELTARLAGRGSLTAGLAILQTDIDWLTGLYTRLVYGPYPPSPHEHRQAVRVWYRLRRRLAWARLAEALLPRRRGK